jgi:hypothetical protein
MNGFRVFINNPAGPVSAAPSPSSSIIIRRPSHAPSRATLRTHPDGSCSREMDVEEERPTSGLEDGMVHVDLDGEVAGGDELGGLGEIRRVLCPPPIPDVADWGIPPESQKPCDPEVEVGIVCI